MRKDDRKSHPSYKPSPGGVGGQVCLIPKGGKGFRGGERREGLMGWGRGGGKRGGSEGWGGGGGRAGDS